MPSPRYHVTDPYIPRPTHQVFVDRLSVPSWYHGSHPVFEDFNDYLSKFAVVIGFLWLPFREMNNVETIDNSHHVLPFRNSSAGKVILLLLTRELDRDLRSAFKFRYYAGKR